MGRSTRSVVTLGLCLALLLSTSAGASASGPGDITSTPAGQGLIASTAARMTAGGHATSAKDLFATRLADGSVLVARRGVAIEDRSASGGGVRATMARPTQSSRLTASKAIAAPQALAAAPYWSRQADDCFASLFRGTAHFDACYRQYKMINDGVAGKEYWRLDFYGTMFAEQRKLRWGWIAADVDSGPVQSFTDWSPDSDTSTNCQTTSVGVSVLGVGASYGYTQCELWDISKSSGTLLGWFKNYWNWGNSMALVNRDRGLAMMIGTKGNDGWAGYGLSWDFAIY
jgi:hypothetical protein